MSGEIEYSNCDHTWLPAYVDTQHTALTVEEVYCVHCMEVRSL